MFVCHQNDVCEDYIGSVYVGEYGGLNKSEPCVFGKLGPVCFLVVCEWIIMVSDELQNNYLKVISPIYNNVFKLMI